MAQKYVSLLLLIHECRSSRAYQYVRRRDVKAALKLFGAEGLDKKKQFEVLLAHAQAGADERDQSEKGGNRENEDTVRDPSAEEADSDEISWLGDGEESDEERQADNGDESESSSEGSYLPSRGRSSTAGPSESGEGPSDQANLIQKSKFLESIPISRRVYPPFVRLPRAYLRHEDEGDYSDGQGRIGSLGSLSLTPWFLPAMAAGDRHATPPLITHQDLKNPVRQIAPSSASGSSYSPSSSDATNTSDVLSEDSDSDDAWATSEDNLEEKDVEQEIEYEKALWASYATDGVDDEQLGSNKQPPQEDVDDRWVCEKATRKRRSINDEEVRPDKDTGDMGFTGNEPKRKRTRRTLRGRKEQSSSEDDRDDSDELVDEWEPGNPLRYADPGMGRVKSAVYILDSD